MNPATRVVNRRPNGWSARVHAFLHPIDPGKRKVLAERWDGLPPELRTTSQVSGRQFTHCGFTTGASYCSFRCTHCYLPANANRIPLPSLAEMRDQIEANRRLLWEAFEAGAGKRMEDIAVEGNLDERWLNESAAPCDTDSPAETPRFAVARRH